MDSTVQKQNGVHYTPTGLARFLAAQTVACFEPSQREPISILDPACGDGQLLAALIDSLRDRQLSVACAVGWDTDPTAVELARKRIQDTGVSEVRIDQKDFLAAGHSGQPFDCVIANPPYVRTQNMGAEISRALADKFKLKGRVDLYQAFAVAIHSALKSGGVVGMLTSNRFLTIRSGADMRRLLRGEFELRQVFDLGDSRLFAAAVLPVVVTGIKRPVDFQRESRARFHRVSRVDTDSELGDREFLDAVADSRCIGKVRTQSGAFLIERGGLVSERQDSVWRLSNPVTKHWLDCVRKRQVREFNDLAEIKVGIKTTADAVFISDQWKAMGSASPEETLLRPLVTHHDAQRWSIRSTQKKVLYPYDLNASKRTAVDLSDFPLAANYLEKHRNRLESRKYLVDSGRPWYEIWVPHQPADWSKPKIVWPDISEQPKFFLDKSGAVVNGDCYWIKLRPGVDPDWIFLILAVANSGLATKFYDTVFHNKLYAGRRRFMTQYVREFPLPDLDSNMGQQLVKRVKRIVESPDGPEESEVETLVHQAFGFG